jgi:hypothetical protein
MDFIITSDELEALCGLPHAQQLAYLRGIRPYMDAKTMVIHNTLMRPNLSDIYPHLYSLQHSLSLIYYYDMSI